MSSSGNSVTVTEKIGEFIRSTLTPAVLPIVEQNLVPDVILRSVIRQEIAMEVAKVKKLTIEQVMEKKQRFLDEIRKMPIAIEQKKANEQHYEVPDEFYKTVLGPHLKYSSGYWVNDSISLEESEAAMLELYCSRGEFFDGMTLIDLGCGWGSCTLFMAKKYPKSRVIGISNSNSQREYILSTAKSRGLNNVEVFTGDIASFDLPQEYHGIADRVISIEMFEHMKNYELLLRKICNWLKVDGKLFVHIFSHREVPDHYESGWMTDNFFTGGTLPSDDLLHYFQKDLLVTRRWTVNGKHYQKTLEAWLKEIDKKRASVMPILAKTYGEQNALKWFVYWRLFFIGCAEFFGACDGEEYIVSHYLFVKPSRE